MAVEWLRSCYQSEWRLFRDAPGVNTPGRYYVSPRGTPFYGGFHNLASRTWNDSNWQVIQTLGEDLNSPHFYALGEIPPISIITLPLGSQDCIQNGDTIADGTPYELLVDGFNPGCIGPTEPASLTWESASDYSSCSIQLASARIIEWSYGGNIASIYSFLGAFLGPAYTINWHAPTTLLPAVTTAVSAAGALAWVDGTVNFQQFALQAAYALVGPQDLGQLSSSPFWYTASDRILSLLAADGADPTKPFFFSGHSYGGVAALIAVARVMWADPTRQVRFLTFGCPHIGDTRFVELVRGASGINLRNDNDIVTCIPPDLDILTAVSLAVGSLLILEWNGWKKAPMGALMDAAGNLTPDAEPVLDYVTLLAFAVDVLADLPFPEIAGHAIATYYARILARCGQAEWPISTTEYAKLLTTDYILMNDGTTMLMNDTSGMLMNY